MSTQAESPQVASPDVWDWHIAWALVFALNLLVPFGLGFGIAREGGLVEMIAGMLVVMLLGHFAVARLPTLRDPLVFGGICTAISQVCPILHVFAGMWAFDLLGRLGPLAEYGGFFWLTLFTAGQLIVVALVCGFIIQAIRQALKSVKE